jgi:ribosomal protein L11 methyltransferase
VKRWPAIDVHTASPDLILAAVDDFSPTAAEERNGQLRLFFSTPGDRDAAQSLLLAHGYSSTPLEIDDEDWARKSQRELQPIRVGRLLITTPAAASAPPGDGRSGDELLRILIEPSMGFGTGQHATTRLCLAALQSIDLQGASLLDAGTGSGILAIAGVRLGAARAIGIDTDPDAIQSARENLSINPEISNVEFLVTDVLSASIAPAGVVTANLTGTLLARAASALRRAVVPGGVLILSGILSEEEQDVVRAFSDCPVLSRQREDEWIGLTLRGSR